VVPSVVSGRYRLLETVRLYALDRLLNTDQLAATRDRHLAWMVDLSGSERLSSTRAGETWELEEQKLAEVANAVAAMEWAEQSGQPDALLSLFIGGQPYWPSTGGLGMSWLDRIPEPAASEPYVRSQWLTTSGLIRFMAGDESKGYEELFAAAAILDERIETGRSVDLATGSLLFRGIYLSYSDAPAALADADRLSGLQIEGESRWAEWMSLMVRTNVLMAQGNHAALDSATQMVAVGRAISRSADDNAVSMLAMLLSFADRFDEALPAAMQCIDSRAIGQSARMNILTPAVRSLAGLGRYEDALDIVEKDFGPMIDSQRSRLQASQVLALTMLLHRLQRIDRINEIAGFADALAHNFLAGDHEVRMHLADIIGGDDAFAALPTPDPAELTPDRIATLIDSLIADIRHFIADVGPPTPAS
jgi:hypothetical protein